MLGKCLVDQAQLTDDYQRGNPMDYEGWAEPEGMDTWDFAHCLPYFKKLETIWCITI